MGSYTTFRIGQDKPSITRHTCIIEQNTNERLNVIKEVINNSGIHLIDTLFIDGDRGWVKELGLQNIEKDNGSVFDWYSFSEADYLDEDMRSRMLSKIQSQNIGLLVGDGINQSTFRNYMNNVAKIIYLWKGNDLLDLIKALLDVELVNEYLVKIPDILCVKYREDIFYLKSINKCLDKDQFITSAKESLKDTYDRIKVLNVGDRLDLSSFNSPLNISIKSTGKTLRLDYYYIFNKLYVYNTARMILKKKSPILIVINNIDKIKLVDMEIVQLLTSASLYNTKIIALCNGIKELGYFRNVLNNYYTEYIVNNYYIDDIEMIRNFKDAKEV